jgi:Chalcone isomerase-like
MRTRTVSRTLAVAILLAASAVAAVAQDITEPKSGASFPARSGDMSLLGVALRTKTFLKVKVYAIGLYVADSAITGPLAIHKGKTGTPVFYTDLVNGDFPKQVVMKFLRDVTTDQIRGAFRETLGGADKSKSETFVSYFSDTKTGQEYVIRWTPSVGLETTVAGQPKPPINDLAFARAIFSVWLGDKPIQEDIKKELVARAPALIK